MIKKILLIVVAIVSLSVAYLLLIKNKDDSSKNIDESSNVSQSANSINYSEQVGKYVSYSPEVVDSTKGRRVLFFHAPWCSQCRALDRSIANGNLPKDVTIFKTDFDSNQKLRQQYGVTMQTTLVLLDENGNLSKKYVSYEEPTLEAVTKNLL